MRGHQNTAHTNFDNTLSSQIATSNGFDVRAFIASTNYKGRCAFFGVIVALHTAVHMFQACVQSGTPHW